MVLPAGISPATWRFEAARSDNLSYGSDKNWSNGLVEWWIYESSAEEFRTLDSIIHLSINPSIHSEDGGLPRTCTVFSPVKSRDFTVKVCNPKATRRRS